MTLSHWLGRRVALIFFSPDCQYCRAMLPRLASLSVDPADNRSVPLILSTGDPGENRRLIERHGVGVPFLLQEDWEVASLYLVTGTPMGYLLDERGATMTERADGADALLDLLHWSTAAPGPVLLPSAASETTPQPVVFPVEAASDAGLSTGTPAPEVLLPGVNTARSTLAEYFGRRVLLIFSDPACEPCVELAPQLERIHRNGPDLQVLMVSRRDEETNRAWIARHGLTFPVLLQRHWDVSRQFGILATPVGYLIDERGMIAAEAAIGAEAILALASSSSSRLPAQKEVAQPAVAGRAWNSLSR